MMDRRPLVTLSNHIRQVNYFFLRKSSVIISRSKEVALQLCGQSAEFHLSLAISVR